MQKRFIAVQLIGPVAAENYHLVVGVFLKNLVQHLSRRHCFALIFLQ